MAGLNRVELATLVDRAARRCEPGAKKAGLARAVVLWLYGAETGKAVPPLLLDVIDEYAETVRHEASKEMRCAAELRQATDALLASATRDMRSAPPAVQPPSPGLFERLTDRERQILSLIANALPNRQIAVRLCISEKTVKNHITSLFAKLGVSGRTEALVVALRKGVLVSEHWFDAQTRVREKLGDPGPPVKIGALLSRDESRRQAGSPRA
jgi:DNA-binding CsgD family transcriptional regulator